MVDIDRLVQLEPGLYVIAVSGGVDSMTLLDVLSKKIGLRLVVAHYDHGIRIDSSEDRRLVEATARRLGLPFVYDEAHLASTASEDIARQKRYEFLSTVMQKTGARALVTAHHLDDEVETALLYITRGTGRKGMSSLRTRPAIERPLLSVPKRHIEDYATSRGLLWRTDTTNSDNRYARNYIRNVVIPELKKNPEVYDRLIFILKRQHVANKRIDTELGNILHLQPGVGALWRSQIISLPYSVAFELVAEWLRNNGIRQKSRKFIDMLAIFIRTGNKGDKMSVDKNRHVILTKKSAEIVSIRYDETNNEKN